MMCGVRNPEATGAISHEYEEVEDLEVGEKVGKEDVKTGRVKWWLNQRHISSRPINRVPAGNRPLTSMVPRYLLGSVRVTEAHGGVQSKGTRDVEGVLLALPVLAGLLSSNPCSMESVHYALRTEMLFREAQK